MSWSLTEYLSWYAWSDLEGLEFECDSLLLSGTHNGMFLIPPKKNSNEI